MPRKIETVTSIGCGIIGQAWTLLFAARGYSARLYHRDRGKLEAALAKIRDTLGHLSAMGILEDSVDEVVGRISLYTDMKEAVGGADFVQESVPERLETKKEVFREVDRHAGPDVVIASSTSGLSMTEIQKAAGRPERCVTIHPFNPPYLVLLVEIVPGALTSEETVRTAYDFMTSLRRVPIIVRRESAGFVGNRLGAAIWREAVDLVYSGVASAEDVDKAVYAGLGLRWAVMGPHLVYHINGGERGMAAFIERYGENFHRQWAAAPRWDRITPEIAEKLVESINQMELVRTRSYDELVKLRDEGMVRLLKALHDYRI